MVLQRTLGTFGPFDVVADLFPGAVLLLGLGSLYRVERVVPPAPKGVLLAAFVVSYVVGHALQWLMVELGTPPDLFRRSMAAIERGEDPPIGSSEIETGFLELCRDEFDLSPEFDDYGRLFELLLSYLDIVPKARSPRFQALFSSFWALETTFLLLGLLGVASAGIGLASARGLRPPALRLAVTTGSFGAAFVFHRRKHNFEEYWVEYVILDFYNYATAVEDPYANG